MAEPALQPLSSLNRPLVGDHPKWSLQEVEGRLIEISEPHPTVALSCAFLLVQEAQANGRHVAWIGSSQNVFYPPDAQSNGIDLECLPVLRMTDSQSMGRAAETLLRCGAFGLIVMDLGLNHRMPTARLAQLNGLARKHSAGILFLTKKQLSEQSIGPLISLRVHTSRNHVGDGSFLCRIHVLRDKKRGISWIWDTCFTGIDGYY